MLITSSLILSEFASAVEKKMVNGLVDKKRKPAEVPECAADVWQKQPSTARQPSADKGLLWVLGPPLEVPFLDRNKVYLLEYQTEVAGFASACPENSTGAVWAMSQSHSTQRV